MDASLPEQDVLAPYQNGYDGLLKRFDVRLVDGIDQLSASIELEVVAVSGDSRSWFRVQVEFAEITRLNLSNEFFVGGGRVLYDGARLLKSSSSDSVVLDLAPGVAWLTTSATPSPHPCVVAGRGRVTLMGLESEGAK